MSAEPTESAPVVELTPEECWALLEGEQVGRLAYRLLDELHLVPVNYAVDGGTILLRTAPGNKLFAAELHSEVAFAVDSLDADRAWSVLVRGQVRRLGEDEQHRLSRVPSWVPALKYEGIELPPTVVTGRRFLLQRSGADD